MSKLLRRLHGGLIVFWVVLWIVATITGWINSVTFVAHLSIVALILASFGAYQGSRAEKKADSNEGGE